MCCLLYVACSFVVCLFVVRRFLFGDCCLRRSFVVCCLPPVVRCMIRVDCCVLCCELFVARFFIYILVRRLTHVVSLFVVCRSSFWCPCCVVARR